MVYHIKRMIALVIVFLFMSSGSVMARDVVVFADWTWESAQIHNRIAAFIAEHGLGYEIDYLLADTVPGVQGMLRGDIDISMESWIENNPELWHEILEDGSIVDLGYNFRNARQGWYVPTFVIEGDPERGIEPMAPDLQRVEDLADYWELFRNPENPRKGRFYNSPTGWSSSTRNPVKLETYGLDEYFESFRPGSEAALETSILRAFQRGEAWVGYYFEPTWIMATYDLTLLEEDEYTPECFSEATGDFGCAFPAGDVKVTATPAFVERAPDFADFLRKYETDVMHTNEALAYMRTEDMEPEETALWFLKQYEDVWTTWVDADVAAKVKAALP